MITRQLVAKFLLYILAIVGPVSLQVLSKTSNDHRVDQRFADVEKKIRELVPESHNQEEFASQFLDLVTSDTIWTNAEGKITSATPTAARLFGYTPDELKDKPITQLMPESYRERHTKGFTAKMSSQSVDWSQVLETNCYGLRKDNSTFPVEIRTRLKDTNHGRVGMSRFTEKKQIISVSP